MDRRSRRRAASCALLLWLALVALGVAFLVWPAGTPRPLVPAAQWRIEGNFFCNGSPDPADLRSAIITQPEARFWRSWSPETGAASGRIVTATFPAPSHAFILPLVGYLAAPGNEVFVENVTTGERLSLRYGNLHENWQEYLFEVPAGWSGCQIRCGAETTGKSKYVGIGTPFSASALLSLRQSLPALLALHAAAFALLALVLRPLQTLLQKIPWFRRRQPVAFFSPVLLTFLGHGLFFLFYFAPAAARIVVIVLLLAGLALSHRAIRRLVFFRGVRVHPVTAAWFFVSLLCTTLLYAQRTNSVVFAGNYRFTPASWSTDNQIPTQLCEVLVRGGKLSELNFGSWLVSDRPPAFSGALTVPQTVVQLAARRGELHPWLRTEIVTIFGVCALATWILPFWELARRAGLRAKQRAVGVAILASAPFVFFNSVYIWPKLLSGTLVLCGWLLFETRPVADSRWRAAAAAGAVWGLAAMTHGSAVFAVLAGALVLFCTAPRRNLLPLALTGACLLVVLLPWQLWVRAYQPPGNALVKFAFAGTFGWEDPGKPVWATVRDAYQASSLSTLVGHRVEGLRTWLGTYTPVRSPVGWEQPGNPVRLLQFYNILPSLGLLLVPLLWTLRQRAGTPLRPAPARGLLALGAVGMLCQLLLMWDSHMQHHYAYGTLLALHFAAVITLLQRPPVWRRIIGGGTVVAFLLVWVVSPAVDFHGVSWACLGFSILLVSLGGCLCLCGPHPLPRSVEKQDHRLPTTT